MINAPCKFIIRYPAALFCFIFSFICIFIARFLHGQVLYWSVVNRCSNAASFAGSSVRNGCVLACLIANCFAVSALFYFLLLSQGCGACIEHPSNRVYGVNKNCIIIE
jgi:hypothetical protein